MARGFHPAPGTNAEVREAKKPDPSKAELLPLGSSRRVAVRAIVAANAACSHTSLPSDILDELSFRKKSPVREAAAQRLNAVTVQGRREFSEQHMPEDSRVPEMAEHVWPGSLAGMAVSGQAVAGPQSQDAGMGQDHGMVDAESTVPASILQVGTADGIAGADEVTPRWTRTAPVRGFRLPG